MLFSIITLFPEMFESVFSHALIKRAQEKNKIQIKITNLRDFGIGKHKTVDDKPYGGGVGMVLKVDVLDKAIESAKQKNGNEAVILLDPKGKQYTQKDAEKFSKLDHIILICGHYEGYDERIRDLVDFEISVGDYVLSGGEIPAMTVLDSVARLVPGVLEKTDANTFESFTNIGNQRILEYPQYTRPNTYKKRGIPKELLSGDPKIVEAFRNKKAIELTKKRRPDLITEK